MNRSTRTLRCAAAVLTVLTTSCGKSPTQETRAVVDWLVAERNVLRAERNALRHELENARATQLTGALPWEALEGLAPEGDASRGEPFLLACPEGLLVVGLRGRKGAVIDRIAPVCGRPDEDVPPHHRIEVQLPATGGTGGKPFELLCAPGEAVLGYRIETSRRDLLGLQLLCTTVHAADPPRTPRWLGSRPTARSTTRQCSDGAWLVGFTGLSGRYVYRLGGLCRTTGTP